MNERLEELKVLSPLHTRGGSGDISSLTGRQSCVSATASQHASTTGR